MRLPWPWPSATGRESLSSTALPYLSAYGYTPAVDRRLSRRTGIQASENIVATHERGAFADPSFDSFDSGQAALPVPRWEALAVTSSQSTQPRTPGAQLPLRPGLACRDHSFGGRRGTQDLVALPVERCRCGLAARDLGVPPVCPSLRCGTPVSGPTSQAQFPGHYLG